MNLGLKDKVALVSGASRGLGFAVARALAAEGAKVSISSRNAEAIQSAGEKIHNETGSEVLTMVVNVRSSEDITDWHKATVARFGGIDLLYPNSGGPTAGPTLKFDDEAWQSAFETLLLSTIRMLRLTVPSMAARGGGAVVLATSTAVKEPIPNLSLSSVMRTSVSALSKTLALELAPQKIRVNQLIPGRIHTDRVEEMDQENSKRQGIPVEEQRARIQATIPMGRYGSADEFASAAVFLFSDAAAYITGATLQADGGLLKGTV
jgi:3-oxoacyl-[acyl-carrier protein] reductase